jgi:hypothetical protein
MHRLMKAVCVTSMLLASASSFAGQQLTPAQCNDYPFVPTHGPVTHAQLMNELSELESVGYQPGDGDEADYPEPLDRAEQRLHAKYQADCHVPASQSLSTAQTN